VESFVQDNWKVTRKLTLDIAARLVGRSRGTVFQQNGLLRALSRRTTHLRVMTVRQHDSRADDIQRELASYFQLSCTKLSTDVVPSYSGGRVLASV